LPLKKLSAPPLHPSTKGNFLVTLFWLERVLFHVMYSTHDFTIDPPSVIPESGMRQIWPVLVPNLRWPIPAMGDPQTASLISSLEALTSFKFFAPR
jgi:hypothetical protein